MFTSRLHFPTFFIGQPVKTGLTVFVHNKQIRALFSAFSHIFLSIPELYRGHFRAFRRHLRLRIAARLLRLAGRTVPIDKDVPVCSGRHAVEFFENAVER